MMSNLNNTSAKPIGIYDSKYYSISKWLLCIFGQWPYQRPLEKKIRIYFLLLFSFCALWPQVRAMVHTWNRFSPGEGEKNVNCPNLNRTRWNSILYLLLKLKTVLDATRRSRECTQHSSQMNILKKYRKRGRIWSLMWLAVLCTVAIAWAFMSMLPKVLDTVQPLNESRKIFDVVPTDYGFNQNEYWWWIQFHIWLSILVHIGVMSSIDIFYLTFTQQICAMYEISRCNLENIIKEEEDVDVVPNPEIHEDIYYHEVVSCIRKHKLIIDYVRNIVSTNESGLLLVVGLNMMGLTVSSYQVITHSTDTDAVVRFGTFAFATLIHLFVITLPGHLVMDSSSFFPYYVYNCKWYMMSLRTRRLIVLIIRSSMEPCAITAGKIYTMSMKNFCSVLKMSLSYLSMLTSMQ